MSIALYRLLRRRFNRLSQSPGGSSDHGLSLRLKSALFGLAAVLILAIGVGLSLLISIDDSESADGVAQPPREPTTVGLARDSDDTPIRQISLSPEQASVPDAKTTDANAAADINELKIASQSWRRGGLGSNALVTFTLRNENPYPVRDVAIACAFSREDGSHLTDRTRVIPGEVRMRSRKTFAAVHVGFVNVNAAKAKCALVAANRH